MGSIEDRVMREVVFRERQEKVAHVEAIAKIVAQVFGLDAERVFGGVVSDYASEVFQETYDPDLLRRKIAAIRVAQARVSQRKQHDLGLLTRLEKMGDFYDREFGRDVRHGKAARRE
jgi:hypothetical protein